MTQLRTRLKGCGRGFRKRVLCAGLTLPFLMVQVQAAPTSEYEIKAVLLLNVIRFVEWPADAFPGRDKPIRIGILGQDPFGAALDRTLAGEVIAGHRLLIKRARHVDQVKDCQVVFVCRSEEQSVAKILDTLKSTPILTVSDIDKFAEAGGNVCFYREAGRIRFAVNLTATRRQRVVISAKLLRLAKIIDSDSYLPPKGGRTKLLALLGSLPE